MEQAKTNSRDGRPAQVPQSAPAAMFLGLGMLGLTIGTLTGMSESPVGAAVVAALFGLLGGGGVFAFVGGAQRKPMSRARLQLASWALFTLSSTCLAAVFVGIMLREGTLTRTSAQPDQDVLINLNAAGEMEVTRQQLMKLIILQSELHALGVPNKHNNDLVGSFLKSARSGEKGLDPDRVGEMSGYARDIAGYNNNFIHGMLEKAAERVQEDRAAIDKAVPAQKPLLCQKALSETAETLSLAARTAKGIGGSADKLRELLLVSVQPDLEVMLDVVSRYKSANVNDPELRIATPPYRRGGIHATERKTRLSIKP